MMQDSEVFSIRPLEWQIRIGLIVLPTIWSSKGAALAGLAVELRRRAAREKVETERRAARETAETERLAALKALLPHAHAPAPVPATTINLSPANIFRI